MPGDRGIGTRARVAIGVPIPPKRKSDLYAQKEIHGPFLVYCLCMGTTLSRYRSQWALSWYCSVRDQRITLVFKTKRAALDHAEMNADALKPVVVS